MVELFRRLPSIGRSEWQGFPGASGTSHAYWDAATLHIDRWVPLRADRSRDAAPMLQVEARAPRSCFR